MNPIHLLRLTLLALLAALFVACTRDAAVDGNERDQSTTEDEIAETRERDVAPGPGDSAPVPEREPAPVVSTADVAGKTLALDQVLVTGSRVSRFHDPGIRPPSEPLNRENYAHYTDNPVRRADEDPVSTFSIDVDTGAYANVRRLLRAGQLPPRDAVRAEELINYFSYDYAAPRDRGAPFSVVREVAPAPWNPANLLLHVGVQGYVPETVPSANLVFLVDVSGSMRSPDKLELLKSSLKLLVGELDAQDSVAIVVYAGASGVVLEPTPGDRRAEIIAALDRLQAGGSTNGAAGIRLAYSMAEQAFIEGGTNRVLIATDGDFNVGMTSIEMLKDLVAEKREAGIALTTLGFGTGNYNDHLMEQIADIGNGNYAYIDTLNEARKVLVDELSATTLTIARDVKIQIEFNPAVVAEYRLIGYENRVLNREDFNNDRVDAGEVGAGHSVTALYEIALVGGDGQLTDPLRYGESSRPRGNEDELAFLRMRYKPAEGGASKLLEWPVRKGDMDRRLALASENFRFAAAVAAFAQQLRGGTYLGEFGYDDIAELAGGARGADPFGYRGEFLGLVRLAESLGSQAPVARTGGR